MAIEHHQDGTPWIRPFGFEGSQADYVGRLASAYHDRMEYIDGTSVIARPDTTSVRTDTYLPIFISNEDSDDSVRNLNIDDRHDYG